MRDLAASAARRGHASYVTAVLLKVLFLLLGVQLIDLVLLVVLSQSFGFWQTLAGLVAVGFVGSALARREGGKVYRGFQRAMAEGRPPEHGIIDGMLVLLGGVLLLLPGVLSDVIGLMLFVPPLRRALAKRLRDRWSNGLGGPVPQGAWRIRAAGADGAARTSPASPPVIDTTGVETPD